MKTCKTKIVIAGIIAVAASVACADGEIKLLNGNVESPADGKPWSLPSGWSVVDGAGRNGSRAIVWDNADPNHYAFAIQQMTAEPGLGIRYSGWIKAERGDIGELRPSVQVDWSDAKGKWMGGHASSRVVDNDPNTHGWARYEGRVTFPAGAASAKFLLVIPRGKTGRVLFDDMKLEMVPVNPAVYLQCGAYRNSFTGDEGDISFAAMLRLNVVRYKLTDYACEVEFKDASNATVVRPLTGFTEECLKFTLPAAGFAMGRQDVALRVLLKGKVVSEVKRPVTRTEKPVQRRISIDKSNRVLIDGRRFFPLGMYTNNRMKEEDYQRWAEAPLNFATMYCGTNRKILDRFAKIGTYVCADVRNLIYGYNYSAVSRFKNFGESRAAFAREVDAIASHPYFFGWYLVDEVPLDQVPYVTAANELLQEIDPNHPTYAVTDKPHHIRELLPTYDAVGMDPYPIGGWKRDLTICSGWAEECREAMFDFRPMWHVPQMFNWNWYAGKDANDYKSTAVMPTRREMANMTWQGIAAGANGICGYSFSDTGRGSKPQLKKFWADVCWVLREVKSMETVLLADDAALPFGGMPRNLVARAYRCGGADYVLIVNRTFENVAVNLKLNRNYGSCAAVCGEGVYMDGGELKVILDGLGYAFLKLN